MKAYCHNPPGETIENELRDTAHPAIATIWRFVRRMSGHVELSKRGKIACDSVVSETSLKRARESVEIYLAN